jgi:hypothetical protein
MKLLMLMLFALVSLNACSRVDRKQEDSQRKDALHCYEHGVAPGEFCRASMLKVVASSSLFDGQQVIVPGFLGDVEGDLYLFPTKDFYLSRDLSTSVRLVPAEKSGDLLKSVQSNVIVFGRFSLQAPDPSTLMKPVGAIEVVHVRNGYNSN